MSIYYILYLLYIKCKFKFNINSLIYLYITQIILLDFTIILSLRIIVY